MKKIIGLVFILLLAIVGVTRAARQSGTTQVLKWQVDGIEREAMVYIPASAKNKPAPVVFVFHGHGGNMQDMFKSHRFDQLWPEAIIVVPQGLKTPGQLVDKAGNFSGWQQGPGDMDDRDIHFFDAMLHTLHTGYQVDDKRIYATGHSNGGSFTYLLWAMRGNVFAAMAPSAAVAFKFNDRLTPKPVMHIMGEADPLVKPQWQRMQIAKLLQLNSCNVDDSKQSGLTTFYASDSGNPVVVYQHPGGHVYPPDAAEAVIKFFKSISKN